MTPDMASLPGHDSMEACICVTVLVCAECKVLVRPRNVPYVFDDHLLLHGFFVHACGAAHAAHSSHAWHTWESHVVCVCCLC